MRVNNIFLDTTEFINSSFNFESKKFLRLKEFVYEGLVNVFITDVVKREVEERIKQHSEEAHSEIKSFNNSKGFRFIRHLINPSENKILNLTAEDITNALKTKFDAFLKDVQVTIIQTGEIKATELLTRYFGKLPPFKDGKKKAEFPDAITLLALEHWCKKNKRKIYVISRDEDLKSFCEETKDLLYLPELGALLEILTAQQQKFTKNLHEFIESHISQIEHDIANIFRGYELTQPDFEIEATFTDLSVNSVDIHRFYIIFADYKGLTLDIEAKVFFQAHVIHPDYDTAGYDSEDDKYYFLENASYDFKTEALQEGTLEYSIVNTELSDANDIFLSNSFLRPDVIEINLDDLNNRRDF